MDNQIIIDILLKSTFAAAAATGFGVLFNIRGLKLILAGIGGGIGWLIYMLSLEFWHSTIFAFFLATFVAAAYSEIYARKVSAPVSTFIICGIIPLVPGGGMYYTILSIIQGDVEKSINNGIKTLAISGTIAVAIFTVSILARMIIRVKQKNDN
jgi:uncharacterized membrane protein YjjB (DUF3815 family)